MAAGPASTGIEQTWPPSSPMRLTNSALASSDWRSALGCDRHSSPKTPAQRRGPAEHCTGCDPGHRGAHPGRRGNPGNTPRPWPAPRSAPGTAWRVVPAVDQRLDQVPVVNIRRSVARLTRSRRQEPGHDGRIIDQVIAAPAPGGHLRRRRLRKHFRIEHHMGRCRPWPPRKRRCRVAEPGDGARGGEGGGPQGGGAGHRTTLPGPADGSRPDAAMALGVAAAASWPPRAPQLPG